MRPRLFFIAAGAVLALASAPSSAAEFSAGVKGGIGLAGLWGSNSGDSAGMSATVRPGFCGGAMGSAYFSDHVGGQVEILYCMKGRTSGGDYASYSVEKQWKTDYLEIPLLLKLCLPMKNAVPLVYAGPSFAFTLVSKYRVTTQTDAPGTENGYVTTDTTWNVMDRTNAFDAGLAVGGGMEFTIETGAILFDVRFTPGFLSRDRGAGLDIKNYVVSFLVGYAYKF